MGNRHPRPVTPFDPSAELYDVAYPGLLDTRPKMLGRVVVEARGVSKSYLIQGREEKLVALRDVNLCEGSEFYPIRRGEFVMILGPSGGGKTTLLNLLGTIDLISSGEISILGSAVTEKSDDNYLSALRLERIGFVFQTFNLIATMSAFENVELPMTVLGLLSPEERRDRALSLLAMVGLRDRVEHLPSELSGGEQQRVTIARALANSPDLLLLDEPTGDLDTRNTVDIMGLLLKINQTQRTTCVMVTHNPDLEIYADRILYVKDGKFTRQAINYEQTALDYKEYLQYLNRLEASPAPNAA
jgi:putative ABC transport system ATP-binding protein